MAITRFEDIEAWQLARKLANGVYDASEGGKFARDFSLKDQIRRSGGSAMHNIAVLCSSFFVLRLCSLARVSRAP